MSTIGRPACWTPAPRKTHELRGSLALAFLLGLTSCAGQVERVTRDDLAQTEARLAPLPGDGAPDGTPARSTPGTAQFDGSLPSYLAYAFEHSPELRASFEDWRAATERPRQQRKLPEPTITYAGFIRSVETRVGPQRHRLGLMQWFPWPSRLTAGGKAEALRARSAQRRFEAHALEIAAQVSRAYWRLWLVHRTREVQRDQQVILTQLSEQVRARVEASMADLADLAQVNLSVSRIEDVLAGLDEAERSASAELVRAVGARAGTPTPVAKDPPDVALPRTSAADLRTIAIAHPRVEAMSLVSDASGQDLRRARADRFPSIGLGVDWIITGDAADPSTPDSGKDPVIAMVALKVPLWGRAYGAAEREARAQGRAAAARRLAERDRAVAGLETALADIRDQARRVRLYETTLVPLAETTYGSVQSSYQAGRSSVAEVLWAERDLLELQLGLFQAQTDYAVAWAELERVVGQPIEAQEG